MRVRPRSTSRPGDSPGHHWPLSDIPIEFGHRFSTKRLLVTAKRGGRLTNALTRCATTKHCGHLSAARPDVPQKNIHQWPLSDTSVELSIAILLFKTDNHIDRRTPQQGVQQREHDGSLTAPGPDGTQGHHWPLSDVTIARVDRCSTKRLFVAQPSNVTDRSLNKV